MRREEYENKGEMERGQSNGSGEREEERRTPAPRDCWDWTALGGEFNCIQFRS